MTEKITFGDIHRLLEECGFARKAANGTYTVFAHEGSGALQAFRSHRTSEFVDPMTLASVRKTLVEFGFLNESEFKAAVHGAVSERDAKAKRN